MYVSTEDPTIRIGNHTEQNPGRVAKFLQKMRHTYMRSPLAIEHKKMSLFSYFKINPKVSRCRIHHRQHDETSHRRDASVPHRECACGTVPCRPVAAAARHQCLASPRRQRATRRSVSDGAVVSPSLTHIAVLKMFLGIDIKVQAETTRGTVDVIVGESLSTQVATDPCRRWWSDSVIPQRSSTCPTAWA